MKYIIKDNKIKRIDISGIIIKGLIDQNSINKEKRIFSGFGSVAIIDRQGDYLPIEEFKPVMEKLMQRGAPVTDSHSNHVVGKIVDYTYKPTPTGEMGLYLTAEIYNHYPTDAETWRKIQEGEYTGFSLGGKAGTKTPTCTNIGCYNILGNIEAWEFSIVERPANQLANIDKFNKLAKASDVVDEVISSIIRKERVYIKIPAEAPRNTQVYTGERGGKYYETEELPKSEKEKVERQQRTPDIKVKSIKDIINENDYVELNNHPATRENLQLLEIYGKIAIGKATDEEVKKVFNKLNDNIMRIREGYTTTQVSLNQEVQQKTYYDLVNVEKQFNNAKDRKDKIIAIDNFMSITHGNDATILTNIFPPRDKDGYILHDLKDKISKVSKQYLEYLKTNIGKSYIVKDGHIIQKPFAGYEDFAQCVTENKDKGDPNAYCGVIKHKVEDVKKEKVYIKSPQDAPEGVKTQEGKRGGIYYESSSQFPKSQNELQEKPENIFNDAEEWKKSLTKEQLTAVNSWMYVGYSFMRRADKNNENDEQLKNFKEAIKTAPKYNGPLFRGIHANIEVSVGNIISLNAISSFSTNKAIANNFAVTNIESGKYIPTNTKFTIFSVDSHKNGRKLFDKPIGGTYETEGVFMKGTSFKVKSIEPLIIKRPNNKQWKGKILHLEEI